MNARSRGTGTAAAQPCRPGDLLSRREGGPLMRRRGTGRRTGGGTPWRPGGAATGPAGPSGWRRTVAGGLVWGAAAAALGASGNRTARRAALRGIGTVAIASAVTRVLARPAARKAQPLDAAGRVASAAAFAVGVLLEAPRYGLFAVPGAAALTVVRTRSGDRRPGDVAVGVAIGVGAAALTARWWPVKPEAAAAAAHPRRPAPALPGGAGLHIVVNPSSGISWSADTPDASAYLRTALPKAEITVPREDQDLVELLEHAARRAKGDGGALRSEEHTSELQS